VSSAGFAPNRKASLHNATIHRLDMKRVLCRNVVANRERSYRVSVCAGISSGSVTALIDAVGSRKSLFVTTPTVARLYGTGIAKRLLESGVDVSMVVVECSEQSKILSEVEKLCQECFRAGLDRTSVLIGCGGGVCTDLVTMAASLTRRGLTYIRIPTTLIGLIDAGVGIKGAVNLPGKKSALGCFYPPEHVLLDPAFLRTLPTNRISEGLAESIKVAVVMDLGLFAFIERYSREFLESPSTAAMGKMTELVWRSAVRLLEQLEPNLYEDKTYRRLLDFGHTFSPLIESESGFRITHGMAVSIDMAMSTSIAFELGLVSDGERRRILRLLVNAGLPIYSRLLTTESAYRALVDMEAHRGGHLNLVLPSGIGTGMFVSDTDRLTPRVLRRALDSLQREICLPAFPIPVLATGEPAATADTRKRLEQAMPLSAKATGTQLSVRISSR
jgi:2-epi-5-epi-valiolone synthase